ncbi:MAG: alpha/beta hydrolase [Anaerolineales bacterium]|nr:alpha/beta hydrolase [Anaerolineales bacterium]
MPYSTDLYFHAYNPEDTSRLPLVLIHGAGGDHLHWPVTIRRLSSFRVYALDLPGHGKSRGHGLQSIGDYAGRVVEWMNAVKLPRAVLIGHSMGGAIALWMGIHYPDRVQGLGLVGTGARLPVNENLLEAAAHPSTFPTAVDKIISWAFSKNTEGKVIELARERMSEVRPGVLGGDFQACAAYDVREQLDRIRVPALVLCGKEDRMTPVDLSESLDRSLAEARLEIIPDAGHMVMIEKPARTAELLKSFAETLKD